MAWTDDQPDTKPRRGHYLVRVLAAAVNPFERPVIADPEHNVIEIYADI